MVGKTYLRYEYNTAAPIIASTGCTHVGILNVPVRASSSTASVNSNHTRGRTFHGRNVVSTTAASAAAASSNTAANAVCDTVAAVPALENVNFWNLKTGNLLGSITPAACAMANTTSTTVMEGTVRVRTATNEVTSIQLVEVEQGKLWHLVVGYASGYVGFFRGSILAHDSALATASKSPINWTCDVFALGHKPDTNVLSLAIQSVTSAASAKGGISNSMDHLLCTGGQDTDISVWDLTAQEPMYRLRGHRGGVVALSFISNHSNYATAGAAASAEASVAMSSSSAFASGMMGRSLLVSGSADGLIKVWDLAVQQCIQSIVATDTQVTSFRYFPGSSGLGGAAINGGRLIVGLRENVIKVYALNESADANATTSSVAKNGAALSASVNASDIRIFNEHGAVARKAHKAVTNITYSPDGKYLCLQSADTLELFAVVAEEEIKRRAAQRRKRKERNLKEKRARDGGNVDAADELEEETTVATGLFADAAKDELTHLRTFNFAQVHNATEVEAADDKKDQRRIRAVSFCNLPTNNNGKNSMHLVVVYNNNSVESFLCAEKDVDIVTGATAAKTLTDLKSNHVVAHSGHRFDIKHMEFTDKDASVVSMSKDAVKLWNLSYASSSNSWQQSTLGLGVSNANRDRVLDEAYYNNIAPPPEQQLICTGSVNPHSISDSPAAFLCCAVIASDLVAVGDEKGGLHLLNLKSGDVVYTDPNAHMGAIKSISKLPNENGFATVGTDRRIITWHLALIKKSTITKINDKKNAKDSDGGENTARNNAGAPVITLQIAHEIELTETPLFVRFAKLAPQHKTSHKTHTEDGTEITQSNELYAVGLQDNNIQLFYADSHKRFLVLYGHKLVATDVDFSDDGQLIASVGIDKALRFWGADFGDCHRAIHAHDDYVTRVIFTPGTHYCFTSSLDGSIKHWDGDTWTMIQQFRSHQRGLYSLCLNSNGSHFGSAGADKCIRLFARTEEMLFPEEEANRVAQEAMDDEAARRTAIQKLDEKDVEVGISGQATAATNTAAEKLMDALDLVSVELQRLGDGGKIQMTAQASLLFRNRSVWEYLWATIEEIRPSELRHCIAALTSIHLSALLQYLSLMESHNAILNYETAAKILLALVAPAPGSSNRPVMFFSEENSIEMKTSTDSAAITNLDRLESLRNRIAARLQSQTDRMEGNIAALKFIMARLTDKERVKFYDVSKIQGHKKKYHTSHIL